MNIEKIKKAFADRFQQQPQVFSAPGRINLIGEHTDYNDGFVLPAAIDKSIVFAMRPNSNSLFRFYSMDYDEYLETAEISKNVGGKTWAIYLLGVLDQFRKKGIEIPGVDCVFGGDIPLGAGLSSSAAVECGFAFGLNELFEANISKFEIALMAQKAEHEYAGVMCGIMDQFAVMHGKQNQVIKLDCRSLDYTYFPFDMRDYRLLLVNTGVKHALAASEYNKRRSECEAGVNILQQYDDSVNALRDATIELLTNHKNEFSPTIYKRCVYVVEENIRVQQACDALVAGDFELFGKLMYRSHEGLKDKYEVSCPELDSLVEIARTVDGVLGSRMMGGGFGGCTINLVERNKTTSFRQSVIENYQTPEGEEPQIIEVSIEDGTGKLQ